MKCLKNLTLAAALMTTLFSTSALADDDFQNVTFKLMASAHDYYANYGSVDQNVDRDDVLASFGAAIGYKFNPYVGMELRHYFGGENKQYGGEFFKEEASLEQATALLLTVETPSLFGFNAGIHAGPSLVKNSINELDVNNNGLSFGGALTFSFGKNNDKAIFLDVTQFTDTQFTQEFVAPEAEDTDEGEAVETLLAKNPISGKIRNRVVSLGFMMKF